MEDPLPVIDWKITSDTASFGGLLCQKATTHFKGRDYTAWFCPDLPIHTGPWKLNGLPGVIMEAYDAKKEVVFKFDGLEKPANTGVILIKLPGDAIKTTTADFERLQELSYKDPAAYSKALTMQAAGPDGNGPKIDAIRIPGPVMNNPVELKDK
jgi:GLPGLI family protein